jgi:diphthamide synthase subunit DPH2
LTNEKYLIYFKRGVKKMSKIIKTKGYTKEGEKYRINVYPSNEYPGCFRFVVKDDYSPYAYIEDDGYHTIDQAISDAKNQI